MMNFNKNTIKSILNQHNNNINSQINNKVNKQI